MILYNRKLSAQLPSCYWGYDSPHKDWQTLPHFALPIIILFFRLSRCESRNLYNELVIHTPHVLTLKLFRTDMWSRDSISASILSESQVPYTFSLVCWCWFCQNKQWWRREPTTTSIHLFDLLVARSKNVDVTSRPCFWEIWDSEYEIYSSEKNEILR